MAQYSWRRFHRLSTHCAMTSDITLVVVKGSKPSRRAFYHPSTHQYLPSIFSKEVHSGCDVVDLDVSPDGLYVVTIGATDAKGLISQAKDGAKHGELEWMRNDYRWGHRWRFLTCIEIAGYCRKKCLLHDSSSYDCFSCPIHP